MNNGADILREVNPSVYFATKNKSKYIEAARVTASFGIQLKQLNIAKQEIQADQLTQIASFAAMQATKSSGRHVVSEDAGFFVGALSGFPGPYSSYVFRTVGTRGILKLMQRIRNRNAYFSAAVAYCEPGRHPICFNGLVKGVVSKESKGSHGFGFDPIFIPLQGDGRTFGEMLTDEKNAISHRAKAFARFSRWFTSRQRS